MVSVEEIRQREPIERSLLRGLPMHFPYWEAGRFVESSIGPKQRPAPPGLVEYVRRRIEETCAADAGTDKAQYQMYLEGLNKVWPKLEQMMLGEHGCGLAEYMLTDASRSLFLPQYYPTLPAPTSLDAPFGYGVRLDGKFMRIPENDPAYVLCANEPIFVGARDRVVYEQQVRYELGAGALVLALGAALLPTERYFQWQTYGPKQNVIAYDNGAEMARYLKMVFPHGDLNSHRVDYRYDDFWNAYKDPQLEGKIDILSAEGVLSYYVAETEAFLRGAATRLRMNGYFCGEVELENIYTLRCGVLGWKMDRPMNLDKNADAAIARITEAAGRAGMRVVRAVKDERNEMPATVWFQLQKVKELEDS